MLRFCVAILLFAFVQQAVAQTGPTVELQGRVVDSRTDAPVAEAHVFLNGSSIGAVTGDDGSFHLDRVPVGSFEVITSHVGYGRDQRFVRFREGMTAELIIRLEPAVVENEEVVVSGERDREWEKNLEKFLHMFLGNSDFARRCTVRNPEYLDFTVNPVLGTLNARASRALEIENRALGYAVTFWLDYFGGTDTSVEYIGKAMFRPLEPENGGEARRWRSNRSAAYNGSMRHFLQTAARGRLRNEGYRVLGTRVAGGLGPDPEFGEFVFPDTLTGMYVIRFPRSMRVEYIREPEPDQYARDNEGLSGRREPLNFQRSWLTLRTTFAYFDESGRLEDSMNLVRSGYWAWSERMAATLPWDYTPDED